ncbi:hypothetical protein BGW80DRAFT_1487994 [Lactifluus volemus]|nr:hypothetical protein BGW80DRAFT_1487994 [Lactifluus volemus]
MRLFKLLSLLSLFFCARASSLKTRQPASHSLDARDLSNDFVQTDPVASTAASEALNGASTVIDELTGLILVAASDSGCNYPDHSDPVCVGQDPCGFTCTDGFTASPPDNPTTCICEAPSVVCNGKCVEAGPCSTSAPKISKEKRWLGSGTCAEMGPEWAACGVFGGGARSWECINTARDLESCGGCVLPLTPYVPIGQDCTSLPGIADVACIAGECVVDRCLPGYVLARDGNHCISRHGNISQHSEYDEDEAESVPARVYGLEHVPLRKH